MYNPRLRRFYGALTRLGKDPSLGECRQNMSPTSRDRSLFLRVVTQVRRPGPKTRLLQPKSPFLCLSVPPCRPSPPSHPHNPSPVTTFGLVPLPFCPYFSCSPFLSPVLLLFSFLPLLLLISPSLLFASSYFVYVSSIFF